MIGTRWRHVHHSVFLVMIVYLSEAPKGLHHTLLAFNCNFAHKIVFIIHVKTQTFLLNIREKTNWRRLTSFREYSTILEESNLHSFTTAESPHAKSCLTSPLCIQHLVPTSTRLAFMHRLMLSSRACGKILALAHAQT